MELITIDQNKCTQCYACVRACPVRAIQMDDKDRVFVDHNRCIACGNCYVNCAVGAISYKNSLPKTQELIQSGDTIAILDPAIAAEFPDITDYRNFVGMIRAIGFTKVCEISFGADLVASQYSELLSNFKGKYYITSACPPVVEYVEKFQPGIIESLLPVSSPLIASAKAVRKQYGNDIPVVAISPCIAQKKEILRYPDLVAQVISFEELRQLFDQKNITENSVEFSEFDFPFGRTGSLYPLSHGILEAGEISTTNDACRIITRDGQEGFKQNIDDFANIAAIKHHLNIYYCKGCSMGPCTSSNHSCLHSISLVADYAHKRIHAVDQAQHKAVLEEFSDMQLMAVISPNDRREPMPPREKVLQVLKILGRDEQENHGCQACGYHSCNAFAIDVAKGIMKPEMCVSYNLRNRQEYIKQLTDSNRKLADTQKALERSQRKMLSEHEAAKETTKMVDDVMQKLPSGIVIVDKDLRILQSNLKFIELIGDEAHEIAEVIPGLFNADLRSLMPQQVYTLFEYVLKENEPITNRDLNYSDKLLNLTVFPIQKGKIVGAVFRDLFEPEVRRDEVVLRITDVIDKNLQMVQQIGFLLGEGASETEKMLNSIIESFRKDTSK